MKKLEAIIPHHLQEAVKNALWDTGVTGLLASQVTAFSIHGRLSDSHRGKEHTIDFSPKVKIELTVRDEQVDDCVSVIRTALVGRLTDEQLLVLPLDAVIRLRDGEYHEQAL